jgi:hypothetical protein
MAVTISQLYPVAGAPPASPNTGSNMVVATVVATAAGDTSAAITHNFNLPASDISAGFPRVTPIAQSSEINSVYELSENPNYTILGLPGVVSVKVWIDRPHSIVR